MDALEEIQRRVVIKAFNNGVRLKNLGSQPAPWMREGLKILESKKELTVEAIELINLSGGTDHPDPTISI